MSEGGISRHRQYVCNPPLTEAELAEEPLLQLQRWIDDAVAAQMTEPTAMTLATCDAGGQPSARVVLMRGCDAGGLCFYTHYDSRKSRELAVNPRAAAVFWWDRLERSVRIEGRVERLPEAQSDHYFAHRPRRSQLSATVSQQSRPMTSRAELERQLEALERRYAGQPVPRPPSWGGFRLLLERAEFWQGGADRLHDRIVYLREGMGWRRQWLQP
ncbi:MAG: pyridoxamine 5'-phosphate oxidase [Gammaproteobacteria bacterium]|nr:pyridoxamine 5'-phosphate oxidase [Gammaproteobacteria bacterium]